MSTPASLTAWLYRPYLDLGDAPPDAPYHVHGVVLGYRNLIEDAGLPLIQASMNPTFRGELARRLGARPGELALHAPADLAPARRSDAWAALCDLTDGHAGLPAARRVRLAWLLTKLGFFGSVRGVVGPEVLEPARIARSPEDAALAFVRAFLDLHSPEHDPGAFETIARHAPPSVAKVDALYQLVLHSAKYVGDLAATIAWMAPFLAAIEELAPSLDRYDHQLLMSRYHRVGGFVPQMQRDRAGVVREMDLSEQYAAAMPRDTPEQRIGADEMTYYMVESRIKEALWLGDPALASSRALKLIELSPNDPRSWLTRGQALLEEELHEEALRHYLMAARFAPPGAEVAWFMAGQCHEALDDPRAACDAYLASLDVDPLGIAAAESLVQVTTELGEESVRAWATQLHADLAAAAAAQTPPPAREFYRHAPAPEPPPEGP